MRKYRKAKSKYIAVCSLTLWLYQPVNAQIEITTLPDSVITVGYARGTLKNISGSVEQITEQQMNKEQITNPLEAIQGRVPGLTIMKSSNGTAALESVRMRGTTSLTSGNDPLIIVDGVLGNLSMLISIYPTDIESFTISDSPKKHDSWKHLLHHKKQCYDSAATLVVLFLFENQYYSLYPE